MSAKNRLATLRERAGQYELEISASAGGGYSLASTVPGLKRDIVSGADLDAIEDWLNRHRP